MNLITKFATTKVVCDLMIRRLIMSVIRKVLDKVWLKREFLDPCHNQVSHQNEEAQENEWNTSQCKLWVAKPRVLNVYGAGEKVLKPR